MNWGIGELNKKRNSFPKILAISLFLGLIFSILFFSSPQIKNTFYEFSEPIQLNLSKTGKQTSNWISSLLNATNLNNENENLKKENQQLIHQISILQSIQNGNRALSIISQTCQDNNFSTVMAGIMGLDNQDILTINKGYDDGLTEGMPVIDQYNVLYGKIVKVYKNFSQVMLISNKNSITNIQIKRIESNIQKLEDSQSENEKTEEYIEGEDVKGIVKGLGGLLIHLDLVPIDEKINIGEVLITSALDQSYPKNILIGKISQIEKNDQKPFQQAKIDSFLNLDNIENLFVITNYKKEN